MKRMRALALWLTGGLPLVLALCAAAETPYDDIATRNAFNLSAPPPPEPPAPPTPPANLKLTGIMTWGGAKKASLMVQDTSGPGKPEISVILREGEKSPDAPAVEMITIDEKNGLVRVKNNGDIATLTFDANGIKVAAAPAAPAAVPGQIVNPPRPGVPNPTTTAIEQPRPRGGLRQIPTRTLRLPNEGGAGTAGSVPVGNPAGGNEGAAPPPQNQPANVSPEEQAVNMLLEREKGGGPPIPPMPGMEQPQAPAPQ